MADPIHIVTEQTREDAVGKVLRTSRRFREAQS